MRRHISLPDLQQGRSEAEVRGRLYRLSQQSPGTVLLLPAPAGQYGFLRTEPCPLQKERKGIFLKKGKKSAVLSRDFSNKYEKRKSAKRFFMNNQLKVSAPQMNLLSMSRLSKSETSLLRPTEMFMLR